ncbi:unnamed protein product, partial [Brassica rapa subsp. trilocularis]
MYVTMSFFDSQAVKMHNQQEKMRGDPRVVVATSVNPKMVGGHLFLNATSGTHIYFDKETAVGESFFYMLVAQDTGLTPATPRLRGYAKVESLSIAELNNFVTTAPSQEIDFVCTGRVTGIKVEKGWCHVSHVCLATILMQLMFSDTVWRCPLQMKLVKLCLSVSWGIDETAQHGSLIQFKQ